ncbi:hypothetical protein EV292_104264 [Sphingomonas sp. BK235]|jgi:hypothetical protein|nr:hypothetical protein EV292_104264 [Sphingomonas sp. BK235]
MTNSMSTRRRYSVLAVLTAASWATVAVAAQLVLHLAR